MIEIFWDKYSAYDAKLYNRFFYWLALRSVKFDTNDRK